MREAYWHRPATEQQFLTIFFTLPPKSAQVCDARLQVPPSILCEGGQDAEAVRSNTCYAQYFQQVTQTDLALSEPATLKGNHPAQRHKSRSGSKFLEEKVDPLKHLCQLGNGSLCANLRKLVVAGAPDMKIQASQSTASNPEISKADSEITIKDLLRAM
ncbi:hypothetical protein Slin15195_G129290 [Septoria linicola]|uniref:Uncharacterized protein n=1 Tax=Septoria linicola TaxID=215465 RepID=A0A9Q9EQY9_9PEZI|nr:hypothetical protein Slin14017_G121820 [Septoria linicola]USW59610.1 hypothetical protein Slin15195_G129290 [Septoria linicola]